MNRTGIRESGCSLMDSGNLYRMEDIWRKIWKRGCCQSRLNACVPGSWLVAWMQRLWSVRLGKEGHRWGQRKM